MGIPKHLSTDHDLLFEYHRWDVEEIKAISYAPMSHPFVERLIGTLRREFLDHVFFWNTRDLDRKLEEFRDYHN